MFFVRWLLRPPLHPVNPRKRHEHLLHATPSPCRQPPQPALDGCRQALREPATPKLRVHCFAVSLGGYGAGPRQSLDHPLGVGGVATLQQYLRAGLVDEMHVAIAPVLLGSGEQLLAGVDLPQPGYRCTEHVATSSATHVVLSKAT